MHGGVKGGHNSAMAKLEKPLGLCPDCGSPAYILAAIGASCRNKNWEGKACKGRFIGTLSKDLRDCSNCGATGLDGRAKCTHCRGVGYFYSGGPK